MDEKTLVYHTKLHQWNDLQQLNRSGDNARARMPSAVAHMTEEKAVEIDTWRREVNKEFIKPKKHEVRPAFWRCHFSAPTSARPPSKTKKQRKVNSAKSTSGWKDKYGPMDITELPNYLAEMSIHYSAERAGLYHGKYAINNLKITGKKQAIHLPHFPRDSKSRESTPTNTSFRGTSERDDILFTPSLKEPSKENRSMADGINKPSNICNKSISNNLLNVVTIDDCNVNLRYRPRNVISSKTVRFNEDLATEDSDYDVSEEEFSPIRVSKGSMLTKMAPQSVSSWGKRAKQQKQAFDNRPKSAMVGRAFDTILETKKSGKNTQNSKEDKFFAKTRKGVSEGGEMYQRLNTTLRKHMSGMVNARWPTSRYKMDPDRESNSSVGYTTQANKDRRLDDYSEVKTEKKR